MRGRWCCCHWPFFGEEQAHTAAQWGHFWLLTTIVALLASVLGSACWNHASRTLPLTLGGQLIVFETLYGRKMYVGLSRVVKPGVLFLAHHDIFAKDAPDNFQTHSLQAQLAANVYLSMPCEGGALQIWEQQLSPEEFDKMRGNSYGIEPEILGKATLEVCPKAGDLILFNSRRMHAVTPGTEEIRLSLSCFIGYRGMATPLTFWS